MDFYSMLLTKATDGKAKLETDITTCATIGAIDNGTTLPKGMTFTEFVKALAGVPEE